MVEVFIRANSGGTRFGKSDLRIFSLLSARWEVADEKMDDLLGALNAHGFAFDRDFVLKTCLVLLVRVPVTKCRNSARWASATIRGEREAISEAIREVLDWVRGKTFIHLTRHCRPTWVLIPLIYIRYHYRAAWKKSTGLDTYLLRCLLAGAFSGQPDNLLDALTKHLEDTKGFDTEEAFNVFRTQDAVWS